MNLIDHPNLVNIKTNYVKDVADIIETRIETARDLIKILAPGRVVLEKDIKGKYKKYNRAIKGLLNEANLTADKTSELVVLLEIERKKKPATRLTEVANNLSLFTRTKIEQILSSEPKEQKTLNKDLLIKLKTCKKDQLLKYLFDYSGYYRKYIVPIAKSLDVKVCPYCNRNYITHIDGKLEKDYRIIGPTFDHFFSQKDHPILAVSFYNLIPSCTPCNSNLKHDKEFDYKTNLHPYFTSVDGLASFDFELDADIDDAEIKFRPFMTYKKGIKKVDKMLLDGDSTDNVNGSLNVFEIKKIYEDHFDIVQEVHEKFDKQSPHHLNSIAEIVKKSGGSEKEFYRFHFNNYLNNEDLNKRPLSRLSRDIYLKLKAISPLYDTIE